MARLAADLKDLILHLNLQRPALLGTSLGCAIIWSYIELYGQANISKLVFVDQVCAPDRSLRWAELTCRATVPGAIAVDHARLAVRQQGDLRCAKFGQHPGLLPLVELALRCLRRAVRMEAALELMAERVTFAGAESCPGLGLLRRRKRRCEIKATHPFSLCTLCQACLFFFCCSSRVYVWLCNVRWSVLR